MTIGEALLNLRKQLGLTQTEMATNVVSTSFIQKLKEIFTILGLTISFKFLINIK